MALQQLIHTKKAVWNIIWLEQLLQDLNWAFRRARRSPVFTTIVVATLALGIGTTTAVFTIVNAIFLRSLPYRESAKLVVVKEFFPRFNRPMLFERDYVSFEHGNDVFENLGGFGISLGANLTGEGTVRRVRVGHITPNFFSVLGVNPEHGRNFVLEDSRSARNRVAVISHALWKDTFASDSRIIEKSIVLDGAPVAIVGVMPQGFVYPDFPEVDIWLPDALHSEVGQSSRSMSLITAIGRLRPHIDALQAEAGLNVIARGVDREYTPPWSAYHAAAQVRVIPLQYALTENSRSATLILFGSVAFILLIACANVANLFLTRILARQKEIAVHAALGASRFRLARLVFTEGLLFAILGGLLGFVTVRWTTLALTFLLPPSLVETVHIDFKVFTFAVICSMGTAILFALTPALIALKAGLNSSLKEGSYVGESQSHSRFRKSLSVIQIALSLVLVTSAGLMIRSFTRLLDVNPGFEVNNVLTGEVYLAPLQEYDPQRQATFFNEVLERVRHIPGIEFAAVTDEPLLETFNSVGNGLRAEGEPGEIDSTFVPVSISSDYFRTLKIQLVRGRFFNPADTNGTLPVVIFNQSLATLCFGSRDPIGRRISLDEGKSWLTVVGVVRDIRHRSLEDKIWPEIYQPFLQSPSPIMTFVLQTSSKPSDFIPSLRSAVNAVDKNQPLANVGTLEQQLAGTLAQRRERTLLLAFFATSALLIAAIGVYGVMNHRVAQRTREIGIRMALGAQRADIRWMVIAEGLGMIFIGIVIGLAGGLALTHVLSSFLYETNTRDPLTFVLTALTLAIVALLAAYVPARRALRVAPMDSLRYE